MLTGERSGLKVNSALERRYTSNFRARQESQLVLNRTLKKSTCLGHTSHELRFTFHERHGVLFKRHLFSDSPSDRIQQRLCLGRLDEIVHYTLLEQ